MLCKSIQKVRCIIVVVVVVYIVRNFNQYIFTNNEKKVLKKLAEKERAHCKLELGQ